MKAVVDRIVQYANRYQLTNTETREVLGTFDFDEVTGTVQQVGTEIDKELFDSIADDLAARVVSAGGELAGTIVTFSDISGTAANVASGDTSATLWGKVKNWFSRLKALAFKNKVAAGDFEAGAIKNADVAADAAIAQGKVNGLTTDYVASISASGRTVTYKNKNGVNMGTFTTQDTTYGIASQSSNGLMSLTDKTKLDGIESGAQKNTVLGVKGSSESAYRTGNVNITKANIGLGNVDNTSDEDKPISTATQTALNGKANTNGTYPDMTAGTANSLTAVQIPNNADLNDYVGSEYWGKVFYATGEQAISNSPVPASYVFHLEVLRLSGNTVQVITAGSSSNNSLAPTRYFRYVSSNLSYGNWEEIVTADGSYPTLGAGHLPNNYIYAGGSSDPKWYKIATISNAPNLAAASLLLSINGIFATQDNQYGAETGQIEFDAANAGGTYSCSATLNYGNINTNNVCVVQNGSTAEIYYHFDSNYQAILVTAMSFYGGSTASYELTNVGVSARPSNAIYAVNRNVAAKVENALTIIKDGVSTVYDGSEAKTVEITESGGSGITIVTIPQDGVSTNPVMSGTIELASPENTVIKIYNGEDNDGARYTYSILTSFDENASGDVPEYVYSGEDYIVTCTKSNGNTYNYTLTETPTPSVDITYATDSDIEALFSGGGVTDELLGTWVLNDSIPDTAELSDNTYVVDFTSNNRSYGSIRIRHYTDGPEYATELRYADADGTDGIYAYLTGGGASGWMNTAYKTITITDTSNLTNREAFTTWLKANATKQ